MQINGEDDEEDVRLAKEAMAEGPPIPYEIARRRLVLQINFEQPWIPYTEDYTKDKALTLPPGKIFECDIKMALGNWAWDKGLTFAGVVSQDESYGFEIKIKPSPDNNKDWIYDLS